MTERNKGISAILILTILYGLLPLLPRYLDTSFLLLQQVYLRMFFGFVMSLIFFRKHLRIKKILKLPVREWLLLAFRAFIYYFLGVVLYTQALLLTKIGNVAVIGALPMTAILGFIILKERITKEKISLVLLSFVGVLTITIKSTSNLLAFSAGELVALISIIFISLGFISRKWHSEALNDKEIASLLLFFAAIFIFIASIIKGEGLPLNNWHFGIVSALIIGGLLNVGASYFMNYGFARADSVLGGSILALDPIFASFFAFIVYRELLAPKEITGGFLIILSAVMLHRLEAKHKKQLS